MTYAAAVNDELRELEPLADVLQLDEPHLQARPDQARPRLRPRPRGRRDESDPPGYYYRVDARRKELPGFRPGPYMHFWNVGLDR